MKRKPADLRERRTPEISSAGGGDGFGAAGAFCWGAKEK